MSVAAGEGFPAGGRKREVSSPQPPLKVNRLQRERATRTLAGAVDVDTCTREPSVDPCTLPLESAAASEMLLLTLFWTSGFTRNQLSQKILLSSRKWRGADDEQHTPEGMQSRAYCATFL